MKKQTHMLSAEHHAHLSKIGVPWLRPPYLKIDEKKYQEAYEVWRRTNPHASPEWLRMKALGHIAWEQHKMETLEKKAEPVKHPDHRIPLWVIAFFLSVITLAFFAPLAHCQFSKISTIQIQNNGTPISFHASPFAINFTGCTVSTLGATDTITCTSGTVTNNPGGTANQLQFNSGGTAFGGIASAGLGKVLIDQGAGNLPAFADPLVQGTQAAGSTTIPSPVVSGGSDYSGTPTVRTWKVDSSGVGYVVFGAPQHVILDSGTVSLPSNAAQETGGNLAIIAGIVSAGKAAISSSQLPAALDGSGFLKTHEQGTAAISAASLPLPSGAATSAKQPALGTAGSPSADVISVQGVASMTALKVDPSGATSPVSAASLPLPSGASTAAKQPALGTAGTPSADVITVQGATGMTAVKVDPSGVTSPVSIAATVNVNCTSGCAGGSSTPADTFTNPTTAGLQMTFPMLWNGSTWDRFYGDKTNGAFVNIKNSIALTVSQATGSNLHMVCDSGCASGGSTTPADTFANPTTAGLSFSFGALWNGTTWDRQPGDKTNGTYVNIKSSVALPATQSGTWSTRTQDGSGNAITSTSSHLDVNIASAVDPCTAGTKVPKPFSITTNTQLVAGSAAKQVYICAINIMVGAATNVALVESATSGNACATSPTGMAGGATAATGWNFAANGGLTMGSGQGSVLQTATSGDAVCLLVSAANQTSGTIIYVQQ